MLEELRLNPRSPGAPFRGRRRGQGAAADVGTVDTNLSTTFAGRVRRHSTTAEGPIQTVGAEMKEGVG